MSYSKYLELLKKNLIDFQNIGTAEPYPLNLVQSSWKIKILKPIDKILRARNFGIFKLKNIQEYKRLNGYDWPANAKTMVGLHRLDNVQYCINKILRENIKGDFVETGVWRGGVIMLMKAILEENKISNRAIWAFDSYEGLPKPNPKKYPSDEGNKMHQLNILSVSLDEVKTNFQKYDLSTDGIRFEKGWFKDTLPDNEIESISLLRLDGDLYESTILALENLYSRVSAGGYVIIDDYNAFQYCKKAVDDYRKLHDIKDQLIEIDKEAVYWKKSI